MGHDDEGEPFGVVQFHKQIDETFCIVLVKGAGRFVGEEETRRIDERPHHRNPLPFAARELAGLTVEFVGETDPFEKHLRPLRRRGGIRSRREGKRGDERILQRGALREEVMHLKNEADLLRADPGDRALGEAARVDPVDDHFPFGRGIERTENVEQGALPATRRSYDGEALACANDEVEPVKDAARRRGGLVTGLIPLGDSHQFDTRFQTFGHSRSLDVTRSPFKCYRHNLTLG